MFDSLTQSLNKVFRNVRGYGKLSEKNIQDALREVRMALLEADVHFEVARDFVARVREDCLGGDVLDSVAPGQQFVKHVNDELVTLLGGAQKEFDLSARPTGVMMLGLHGAGKTTTCGKLARRWVDEGKKVLLVACDIRRPAAVDQLQILADQVGADFMGPNPGEAVPKLGARALAHAKRNVMDRIIYDTGGRFQIDDELVQELKDLREITRPGNVVLVVDSAIGQESVSVAQTFHDAVQLTGLILTKLDGDARGGAALSIHSVTGCPVLMVGTGEKAEDLEPFYPDRMASRILGMGDVVSLVEKAQEAFDDDEMVRMEERLRKNSFDLEDFLLQIGQLKKLGSMQGLMEMMPGLGNLSASVKEDAMGQSEEGMKKAEAIIYSMTIKERRRPTLIDASRRKRIARGCGMDVSDVNELLRNFKRAQKMAKKMKKHQKRLLRQGR